MLLTRCAASLSSYLFFPTIKTCFYEEGNPKLKECFWIYCRKTWTKAITTANHSRKNISFSQWELEVKTKKLPEARGFKLTNCSLVKLKICFTFLTLTFQRSHQSFPSLSAIQFFLHTFSVRRMLISSTNNPISVIFLYSHHLSAWFCIEIARRNYVSVTHES